MFTTLNIRMISHGAYLVVIQKRITVSINYDMSPKHDNDSATVRNDFYL